MPSLVEISQVVFYILSMYFCYFTIIYPCPFLRQTCIPITQGCFVPSLIEIGPVVLSKKIKMWKIKQDAHWPFRSSKKIVLFNKQIDYHNVN